MPESLLSSPIFEIATAIFGLLIGSFLNVVILRLPRQMEHEWRCQCRELLELEPAAEEAAPPGITSGRSRCPHCGHGIRAWENIPVLSFLLLRGRCSACGASISWRYPLVETFTALAFALVAYHFGPTLECGAALILTAVLIALAGIDLDHQLLPDNLTLSLLWLGLLASLFGWFSTPVDSIVGAAAGYGLLWSVYYGFRLLTGKEGMGYGDFKLLGAVGAWLGWQALPLTVLLSSMAGAVTGLSLMATRRHERGQPLPFGPFIALAGWITLIWGDTIVSAYLSFSALP